MFVRLGIGVLAVLGLAACAGMGSDSTYDLYVTQETPFYEYGPQQTVPPSKNLTRGTRVRVLTPASSTHAFVETVSGEQGYVAKSALSEAD
jgi:hypothetical protein